MHYPKLLAAAQREFPNFRVSRRSESKFLGIIFWFLRNVLQMKTDYNVYITTIMNNMWVPDWWFVEPDEANRETHDRRQYSILAHELVHVRQFHTWPLGRFFLFRPFNSFLMAFCYVFVLPVFWTMRGRFEREAYETQLLAEKAVGMTDFTAPWVQVRFHAHLRRQFVGPAYFFMDTEKSFEAWATSLLARLAK